MLEKAMRYFALHPPGRSAEARRIFRHEVTDETVIFEYLSREGEWIDHPTLASHLVLGEPGATEITEQQANAMALRICGKPLDDLATRP